MLEIQHVTKRYRNVSVVDDVSFTVRPGEVAGYLGPNGSGKSTTVKITTFGRVLLDGRDIREDVVAFKRRLGYVPEEAILYTYLSGLEYLQLIGGLRGMPEAIVDRRANELLELFSLRAYRHAPISAYSKGMKQRVLISAALLHDPDVLVLDEPFSGLDPAAVDIVVAVLREHTARGVPVLFSSHQLDVVERICDDLVIIADGSIRAAGHRDDLRVAHGRPRHALVVDGDAGWLRDQPGVTLIDLDGPRAVFDLAAGADDQAVLQAALARGPVRSFGPVVPSLAEIFREVTR
jgi:ABC-2 type transport system ATP-binding protein